MKQRKHIVAPMEIKSLADTGRFSGYASVFGNKDLGWDVIEPGAFTEIVTNKDGKVRVLFMHDDYSQAPIGLAKVEQDDKGLAFEADLIMDMPRVRDEVYPSMKAGALDGMSIGFNVLPGGAEFLESGVRLLKSLKLWEISVVTFGMNPLAGVDNVKTAGQITTIREFEEFLRDAGGFSHAQAKLLASGGFKALQKSRDETDSKGAIQQLLADIAAIPVPKL